MHGMPTAIAGRLVLFIRLAPDAQLVALGDDFALFGTKAGALHVQAGRRSGGAQSLARASHFGFKGILPWQKGPAARAGPFRPLGMATQEKALSPSSIPLWTE